MMKQLSGHATCLHYVLLCLLCDKETLFLPDQLLSRSSNKYDRPVYGIFTLSACALGRVNPPIILFDHERQHMLKYAILAESQLLDQRTESATQPRADAIMLLSVSFCREFVYKPFICSPWCLGEEIQAIFTQ